MPLLVPCVALLLASSANAKVHADLVAKNEPSRDVWVFRCVLDHFPRMATLALGPGYWLSYDASNCGLYKFWKGEVKFDGAVYTTVHGPQPTTDGPAIEQGSTTDEAWTVFVDGKAQSVKPRYRGHRFDLKDRNIVHFQYDFKVGGKTVRVNETPTLLWSDGKPVGLRRQFSVGDYTADGFKGATMGSLSFEVALGNANGTFKHFLPSGGTYSVENGKNEFKFSGNLATVDALMDPAPGALQTVIDSKELYASISPQGGSQDQQKKEQESDVREAGLAYRGYQLDRALLFIPRLVPNQTPNVSRKIDQILFFGSDDFGLQGKMYVDISGWIKIKKPGLYLFRLSSDDGSRLTIRGEKVIDNDGVHEAVAKEGSLELDAGSHPMKLEYFNNTPDSFLQLEWKKPGDANWDVVPADAFETLADEVRVTSPGNKKVIDSLFPQRPGDGRPLLDVHPSFDLTTPRPKDFNPRVGGMDFYPDGRMVMCTWDPDGAVYEVSGTETGDPSKVKVKKIATGLSEPLGIKIVGKDIYVFQKGEMTRLRDLDGDGIIDEYYCLCNGFGVTENFHEFSFGLVYDKGYLYGTLAIGMNAAGRSTEKQNFDRGRVIKVNATTGDYQFVASGLRTPNGISKDAKGRIFITDNQGDWLPSCKLLELTPGAFYGNRSVDPDGMKNTKDVLPICWFPQGEIGNSTSQPASFDYGPYKGQMIVGDVTHGGLKRVFMENVNGRLQGTAFRLTQGLEAGINRVIIGPDKSVYVGGIGSTGNWGQEGKERYGLQRLTYNGKTTFEMLAVRPAKNGAEIELTEPLLDNGLPYYLSDFYVDSWTYVPENTYGGPKVDEKELPVKSLTISKDRKKIFLEFDGVQPNHVLYFKMPSELQAANGDLMWSTEAWSTVNSVPNRTGKVSPAKTVANYSVMSAEEKAEGFKFLFDGSSMDAFRGYNRKDLPKGWVIADGVLAYVPGVEGGDIITKEQYGDFELRMEWKISEGGNSGIMYHVQEGKGATFETGIEMQVLDNARHSDGKNPLTSAGSAYGLYAPTQKVVLPADQWNRVRIVCKGNHVEHWLNGVKVVEYEKDSPDFKDRLAKSKFKDWADFAKFSTGYIALQDHGDTVAFRNIRIRKL
ncbi:MAG: DUF1080 domain-containing protein [Armatimonadetes bacterium]|nr:DUF1080 domain-containing protein [Armatimonadota bacterium]